MNGAAKITIVVNGEVLFDGSCVEHETARSVSLAPAQNPMSIGHRVRPGLLKEEAALVSRILFFKTTLCLLRLSTQSYQERRSREILNLGYFPFFGTFFGPLERFSVFCVRDEQMAYTASNTLLALSLKLDL
jgi:hypothetical protein